MIRIEVQSATVFTRSGVSARTGRSFEIRFQQCVAYTIDRDGVVNPGSVEINIPPGRDPYQPGVYELIPSSVYVNRFRQLEISPVLRPVIEKAAA